MSKELVLIILAVVLVLEISSITQLLITALKRYRLIKDIIQEKYSRIGSLGKAIYKARGCITNPNHLNSPLSGQACVYYQLNIIHRMRNGDITLIDEKKYKESIIEINDASGNAFLDMRNCDTNLQTSKTLYSSIFNKPSSKLKEILMSRGISSKFLFLEKALECKEYILKHGEEVFVFGEVAEFTDKKPIFRETKQPLLISNKSEEERLSEAVMSIVRAFIIIVLQLLGLLILYIVFTNFFQICLGAKLD